jgi:hypothetical protein
MAAAPMDAPKVPALAFLVLASLLATVGHPSSALAGEIHVPSDYPTIQQAIDAALPGSLILVAPGTYTGPENINLDFGGKDLELRGVGGPEVTIIDVGVYYSRLPAEYDGDPPCGLRFHSGETAAAVVDGFTITNGLPNRIENGSSPTIRNSIFSFHILNGAICNNASPIISHCTFTDNGVAASVWGAGIHCSNNSLLRVDHCSFVRNRASGGDYGGGIFAQSSSLIVSDCVFRANDAEGGGGIATSGSQLTISNCDFLENYGDNNGGGGILCWQSSTATITGCRFYDNRGCGEGAGLAVGHSSVTVTHCSFAANGSCSQVMAGGPNAILTMENSIIAWGAGAAVDCFGGTVTIRCSDIFGNQGGDWIGCLAGQQGIEGNFAADPLFCDLPAGDLTLHDDSPCLPGHHPQGAECGRIGALDQGCGATAVAPATWGAIKAAVGR